MDILAVALVAFTLAGFVKGVVGFGFPVITLIILTLTIGLLDALAIIVIPTIVTNIWQAFAGPYFRDIARRMWLFFLVAMTLVWLTSAYLTRIDVRWPTATLGAVMFLFAMSRLLNLQMTVPRAWELPLSVPLGAINGALTGMTGSFMVPSVLFMQAMGFGRDMLVQAMGIFFALSTLVLALSLGRNELISGEHLRLSAFALLPSLLGLATGRWVRFRIDEKKFQQIFLGAVSILGSYICYQAIVKM
ncbi:MAG: sulfite exporter TauE/SafE family protein [Woeseiaceae bacterium]|nr:sulfite exporter TauE/SafE family protein [Woeseiaceae bacterium]